MRIRTLQQHWDGFGRTNPLWAVLTQDEFRVDGSLDAFMATGAAEIERLMEWVDRCGLRRDGERSRALDFGCGVGRCCSALAGYYGEVVGVDIAESMIEQAKSLTRSGRVRYLVNDRPDLRCFDDNAFDLVYSTIVLQHMEPRYSKRYLRDFVRVLRPGGALIFQIPIESIEMSANSGIARLKRGMRVRGPALLVRSYDAVRRRITHVEGPVMEMFSIPRNELERIMERSGARIVEVVDDASAGSTWKSLRFMVTK